MRIAVCVIVLIWYSALIVHATPPPPEGRVYYLLPNPDAPYYNQSIDLGLYGSPPVLDNGKSSLFPRLSGYWLRENYYYPKTGKDYRSEVWYFDDWTKFNTSRDDLLRYVQKHGTVSPSVLDVTVELARTNDPYISGLRVKQIPSTKYTATDTSGYFVFLSTDFFPGENYYIAYYGVDGMPDLVNDTTQIKTLIMSCLPGFVEKRSFTFNPASPPNSLPAPLPAAIGIAALAGIGTFMIALKKRGV